MIKNPTKIPFEVNPVMMMEKTKNQEFAEKSVSLLE